MLSSPALNPFLLLLDPSAVMKAVESSSSLCSLKTRVFRPLEAGAGTRAAGDELAAYDAAIDIETETNTEMDIASETGAHEGNDVDRFR